MKTIEMKWVGIRPLLEHNARLCDPRDPIVIEMKKLTGKKNKTEDDYKKIEILELLGSVYWSDEKDMAIMPSDNIERCIQLGGQKSKKGKDLQACVFCQEGLIELHHSGPKGKKAFLADPKCQLRKPVVIQKNRVFRVRPMFSNWWIQFVLEYDETVVNASTIVRACIDAGALIGLGDWRPKFGRFMSEVIKGNGGEE